MKNSHSVLLFDIETFPHVIWAWDLYDTNAIDVKEYGFMLSFAYKWFGESKIQIYSLPDFRGYNKDKSDDKELCQKLWELFDEANIVIGHNGVACDVKTAKGRFFIHGFKPPSPFQQVDTLKVSRKEFKLPSNKLDFIAKMTGIGKKKENEGFPLWRGCAEGDLKAWKKMIVYNKQDVQLLEEVYLMMRPYIENHPNLNLLNNTENKCPNCGGDLQRRGFSVSRVNRFQRFQCQKCGAWSQKPIKRGIIR